MVEEDKDSGRRLWLGLHPAIYLALAGCAVVMAAATWLFDGGKNPYVLSFAAIGGLAIIATVIPSVLSRFARRRAAPEQESLHDWSAGDIEVYGHDRMKTRAAAVMILIAPLSGAVGLVVLAIVANLATGGRL